MAKTKEMTQGKPMGLIIGFALPLLFGFLFQQFYSVVDTMIVGQVLGVDALAAVGSTGSVNFLIIGFCMGICNGFAIPIAQKFGARDYVGMRRFIAHSVYIICFLAVAFTTVVSLMTRNILIWMQTPDNILDQAYTYILIIFIGIPTMLLYNMMSGIIRAMGDSKTPLVFLIISSFMNIALDLFCMVVLKMGVEGAAIATVISQAVSGIACLIYSLKKYELIRVSKDEWRYDQHLSNILLGTGVPMGLQYSITAIGSVILQTSVNTLGSDAVAAITAANKVLMFLCCPYDALGSTMATWGGQNIGAKKLDRIGEGLKNACILGITYCIFAFAVIFFFGGPLISLFLGAEGTYLLPEATKYSIIVVSFHPLLALVNIVRFLIQGMGFSVFAILAGVCEMVGRVGVGVLMVPAFGFTGAAFASPLAWVLADAFLIPAYFYVMKKVRIAMKA